MKYIIISCCVVLIFLPSSAIFSQSNFIENWHLELGGNYGFKIKSRGINSSLNLISRRGWFISGALQFSQIPSNNLPQNYQPSMFLRQKRSPGDKLNVASLHFGKRFLIPILKSSFFIKLGVSNVHYSKVKFSPVWETQSSIFPTPRILAFDAKYPINEFSIGFDYGVKYLIPFNKTFGLIIDFSGNRNRLKSYFGGGASLVVGGL